jgi:type I restriction enzyme S subunit
MKKKTLKGWNETTLGDVAKWSSGGTPSRSNQKNYGGIIPWIKTGDLNDGFILEASEFITEEGLKNSSAKLFPIGSVAIAMYGATIGKTGIFGIEAATNQACGVGIPIKCGSKFLFYFLKSQKQNFVELGKGGAQPNISQGVIKDYKINLPPLTEQQRIVSKLDQIFSHLETAKKGLEKIPVLLKQFRQAVLTQAVTGKLTEEWREGKELGDIDEYLKQLLLLKEETYKKDLLNNSSKKRSKPKVLPLVEDWENEFDVIIPEKWKFVRFNHISYKIGDVDHKMPKSLDSGYPYLSTGDMKDINNLDFENCRKISKKDYNELSSKIKPERNDIIFPRYGTIGRNILVAFDKEFLVSYSCAIIKNHKTKINPKYVYFVSISPFIKLEISKHVVQTTQANIGIASIEKFLFPLCNIEEQTEIVRRIEALFSKADEIEARYKVLKEKIDNLPQAVLAKAFRGEL